MAQTQTLRPRSNPGGSSRTGGQRPDFKGTRFSEPRSSWGWGGPNVGPDAAPNVGPNARPNVGPNAEPNVGPNARPDCRCRRGLGGPNVRPNAGPRARPDPAGLELEIFGKNK